MMVFKGLSAFPITPSDASGRVDTDALRKLLARLVAAKVDSIGLLGSTGSYPYLTRTERRRAIEVAMETARGETPILVGVGALRTDEAVQLAQDAKAAGAAGGLLAPVSYTPLTDDEVFEHFATVARASGLPLWIYDNFSTTHFKFTPALVGRLAQIPGVVAVKSTAPEPELAAADLADMRKVVPAGFSVGYAADWKSVAMLLAGADAWYSVAAGLFPRSCLAIVRAAQAGRADEAWRLDGEMAPLWALCKEFSSLRVMYAAAGLLDICRAEPPRPILPLPEAAQRKIADTLKGLR
ncbi:dihydrodipicolinate synthase family protein [Bradyrhizobium prioriisuperbiae]|uniref:dihydrodipicolinate synthase family protein n=1 Tax=Bradyrhizobium prioriisuperbiae TaxID=2854389 RepID=UPI0028E24E90|nr:dihydrodipicolinate synthase family protein [Bradyrhizobium prioritasuperba]